MHRLKVSKYLRTNCPAVKRAVLVTSCSQGADQHCECFQDMEVIGSTAFVLCDYGFEDQQTSIIVPGRSEKKK